MNKRLTAEEVADALGVDVRAVLGWIKSGELVASNLARSPKAKKPRWRIRTEDVEAFERERLAAQPTPTSRKPRRLPKCRTSYF